MVKMHIHQLYTHAASYILSSLSCISVKEFYKNVAVFDVIFSLQKILAGRVMKAQVHHPIYTQQKSEVKIAIVGLPFRVVELQQNSYQKSPGYNMSKIEIKTTQFSTFSKKQLGGVYNTVQNPKSWLGGVYNTTLQFEAHQQTEDPKLNFQGHGKEALVSCLYFEAAEVVFDPFCSSNLKKHQHHLDDVKSIYFYDVSEKNGGLHPRSWKKQRKR